MSFLIKLYFRIFSCVCVFIVAVLFHPDKLTADARVPEIMSDYFWGSHELRSSNKPPPPSRNLKEPQALTCDSEILQIICFNKCGDDYICQGNKCKCSENGEALKVTLRFADDNSIFKDNKYIYSDENDMPSALRSVLNLEEKIPKPSPKIQIEDLLPPPPPPHPALRHHIAHFCPSIRKAKECIRTCMKQGIPAFCGKDHKCYCGHRYSAHDNQTKADVNDVYLQFKDIYEKYFGPKIFDMDESADEE